MRISVDKLPAIRSCAAMFGFNRDEVIGLVDDVQELRGIIDSLIRTPVPTNDARVGFILHVSADLLTRVREYIK